MKYSFSFYEQRYAVQNTKASHSNSHSHSNNPMQEQFPKRKKNCIHKKSPFLYTHTSQKIPHHLCNQLLTRHPQNPTRTQQLRLRILPSPFLHRIPHSRQIRSRIPIPQLWTKEHVFVLFATWDLLRFYISILHCKGIEERR